MTDARFVSDIAAVLAKLKQDRARPDLPLSRKVTVPGTPAIPCVPPNTPATANSPFATPARSRAASASLGSNKNNSSNGGVNSNALTLNTSSTNNGIKSFSGFSDLDDPAEMSFSTIATAGSGNALWEGDEEAIFSSDEEHAVVNDADNSD